MPSVFDRIETNMARDMMCAFGSDVTIVPMKARPNKPSVRDTSRATVTLKGAFYDPHTLSDMDKNSRIDRANKTKSMSYNSVSTKHLRVTVNLCDLIDEPKQFDAVIRVGVQQAYEITDLYKNGSSAMDLVLSEVEGPFEVSY